jgi:hypothetical protein
LSTNEALLSNPYSNHHYNMNIRAYFVEMKQRKKSGLFFGFFAFREMASPLYHGGSKVLFARKKSVRTVIAAILFYFGLAGLGNLGSFMHTFLLLTLYHSATYLIWGPLVCVWGVCVEQPIVFTLHVAQISKEPRQVQPLSLSLIPLPLLILIF